MVENVFCYDILKSDGYSHKKLCQLINTHPIYKSFKFASWEFSNFYIIVNHDNGDGVKRNYMGFTGGGKNGCLKDSIIVDYNQLLEILGDIDPKELKRPFYSEIDVFVSLETI